jgi:hypothetical protein
MSSEEISQEAAQRLLAQAAEAANSATNGLLNRGDLEETIARLSTSLKHALAACERLRRDRDHHAQIARAATMGFAAAFPLLKQERFPYHPQLASDDSSDQDALEFCPDVRP